MSRHLILYFRRILENCVLSDGTKRGDLPRHQSDQIKIFNIYFLRVEIEPTTCHVYSHNLRPRATIGLSLKKYNIYFLTKFLKAVI